MKKKKLKYLTCIWCGKENKSKKYAKYCSKKCQNEALGYKPPFSKQWENEKVF